MGYVARYYPDIERILYSNALYQYVQNYLEYLYGYKDFTNEFADIINSIKNTFNHSTSIPLFMYYELMDDYRFPGEHSGGSFSVCLGTLYRLIKINASQMSKKEKLQSWREFCIINRLY